jgi:ABC-type sugar transport system substrate-binding protein
VVFKLLVTPAVLLAALAIAVATAPGASAEDTCTRYTVGTTVPDGDPSVLVCQPPPWTQDGRR